MADHSFAATPRSGPKGARVVVARPAGDLSPHSTIRAGDQEIEDVVIPGPHHAHFGVPDGDEGELKVELKSTDTDGPTETHAMDFHRELPHAEVPAPAPPQPGPSGAPRAPKPGDPTRPASNWWMLHQALEHASHAAGSEAVPLKELWSTSFPSALGYTQPILGDGTLLVGVYGNGPETIVALDPTNGAVTWQRTGYQISVMGTPVAVNGRVYCVEVVYPSGHRLVCLEIADGTEVWVQTLDHSSQSGLAAAFGLIYLLTRDGTLSARKADDGALVWSASVDVGNGSTLSSPAVGFGKVYVGTRQGLRAFDAHTGNPETIESTGITNGNASPLIVTDVGIGNPAVVVIGDDSGTLRAYHVGTGQVVWTFSGNLPLWYTTPSFADGRIYLRQTSTIVALDPVTGTVVATSPALDGPTVCAPTLVPGHVVLTTGDNRITVLDRPALTVSSTVELPGGPAGGDFAHPSAEDGRMYLTSSNDTPWPAVADTLRAYHKGCLVVTAAYGSPLAPEVAFLRSIRDEVLRPTALGAPILRILERIYYSFSPTVSDAMDRRPWLRHLIRTLVVAPVVRPLYRLARWRGRAGDLDRRSSSRAE